MGAKTVIFEKKYGVDLRDFRTTEQIDEYMKDKLGRDLEVKRIESGVVTHRGNVFPLRHYDIEKLCDNALRCGAANKG